MRIQILPLILVASATLTGQTTVRLTGGATYGTDFVKDFIAEEIGTRQTISPTVTVAGLHSLPSGYRIGAELRYATGNQETSFDNETEVAGGLSTLALSVMVDGPLRKRLRWEATVGMIRYMPENEIGVFSDGSPSPLLVGAGISWYKAMAGKMKLVVSARYDFHSFITTRLESAGYSSSQAVHRAGITVGLERDL